MLWTVSFCRFLLAATFIFSGFVKAVDPQGMAYKLNVYLDRLQLALSQDSLLLISAVIILTVVEFMLGIYLLLGIRRKFTTQATSIFMACMTAITIYVYAYNSVPDCGCFGSAITLTNGQTLAKNVILLLAAVGLTRRQHYMLRLISERNQWITSLYALVYIVLLSLYAIHYLPPIDFTPFSVGTDMRKAYKMPTEKTPVELINFSCSDKGGKDFTDSLLARHDYTFLLTLPRPATADEGCNDRINDIFDACHDQREQFFALIPYGTPASVINSWTDRTGATYSFLQAEQDIIKTMVRSNPGLLLLHNGVIVGKWSNNDLPDLSAGFNSHQLVQSTSTRAPIIRLVLWFFIPLSLIILGDRIWIGTKYYKHHILQQRLKKTT